ncbi:FAD:protein FMN transferase [Tepidiforma thermophila]|uniref:FAD:protein FMN transferase n=1 Tax=Tepidiforma thermophila (strain KCTC 52669 / CGMCC 1.13589 / G233) TaxID=2761530 RepID=A0A2A9HD26_TEPT2|nr:FAD:protein FMN transferase [Tepidiforma thermophila]PFG73874.1 thiamine biosynthesis lipoprotein [Tepidiforma thermophila]
MEHIESFRAMDTGIDLIVIGGERPMLPFLEARLLFDQQEERFSRFRPSSLVSRLNRGETVADPWLDAILPLAVAAWEATDGLFNPLVLPALAAAGYDRTFSAVAGGAPVPLPAPGPPAAIERTASGWRLREGQLDLGGIVKGWTADLAAEHLAAAAAAPAMVNAGGDIRCIGEDVPGRGGWELAVEGPSGETAWSGIVAGALATSTTLRRRWTTADGRTAHHLIDPRTGLPAASPFVQVSVIAPTCREAETWAKAVLVGGHEGLDLAASRGIAALALAADGTPASTPAWPS